MKYVWVLLCLLVGHAVASDDEIPSLGEPSMLLALMADAKEENYEYTVNTSIISDYKISSYRAYVYFEEAHTMRQLHEDFVKTRARLVNFTFESPHLAQGYLVLEVKYGPNFLYDTNATGLCVVPFDGTSVFDQIPCNPLITAEYLLASTMAGSSLDNIINADATRQFLQMQNLPNRKFWQDYLAVHQLVLAHLAEIEDYHQAHSGRYLEVAFELLNQMLTNVRKYRRLKVQDIDDAAIAIDKTMVNFAYRLYMSIDGLLKRNLYLLPKVEESPTFVRDFFTGRMVFSLLTEEAAVVSGLTQQGDTLIFYSWPWFEYISVRFDSNEPMNTTHTTHKIPSGARRVDVIGYGALGRYPALRYTILPFGEELKAAQLAQDASQSNEQNQPMLPVTPGNNDVITVEELSEKVTEATQPTSTVPDRGNNKVGPLPVSEGENPDVM